MHKGLGFAAVGDKLLSLEGTAWKDLEAELEIQLLGVYSFSIHQEVRIGVLHQRWT